MAVSPTTALYTPTEVAAHREVLEQQSYDRDMAKLILHVNEALLDSSPAVVIIGDQLSPSITYRYCHKALNDVKAALEAKGWKVKEQIDSEYAWWFIYKA